jgi:response regulator RpfG family c-di-GMP phosphodiesterase
MYVDDQNDNLQMAKRTLEDHFEVFCFQSPAQALKEVKTLKPVIVLSDLRMPSMNGVEFLELVQQLYSPAKRIIITGNSDESSVIAAIKRASIYDFLKKPINEHLEKEMLSAYAKFSEEEEERRVAKKVLAPDLMEHPSWLHKISEQLREVFTTLSQYKVTDKQIEDWSILIHLSMSAEKRYYHNAQHLFDIWDVSDAFERLAILFHDVVYAQVDKNSVKGMLPQIVKILGPLMPDRELKLQIPEIKILKDKQELEILYSVFGRKSGDVLNATNGMNEFLSARVVQHVLSRCRETTV